MHPAAGGPPIVVERLCLLAPSEGWESSVVTTSLYCEDDGSELQKKLRDEGIDAEVLPIGMPRFLKRARGSHHAVDEAVRLADIVHLHTLWHPLNSIARKACARHRRRYVMMPHGMLDPYSLQQRRWRKQIYLAARERRNLEGACRLIFTTSDEQQAARASLSWLGAGEIIPLGADGPPEMPRETARQAFIERFPQAAGRRCLLFLGRIHPKKGLDHLLAVLPEIARNHPSILLVIAGNGEDAHVHDLESKVRSAKLEPHVLLTGRVEGSTKWSAFGCAEIFVLLSRQENFAISVAEAMHSAVPVVITDKVNSWPFVEEAGAGLVIREDKIGTTLAHSLQELLSSSDTARRMGRCGREFARKHFTWQRVANDMMSLYDRVVKADSVDLDGTTVPHIGRVRPPFVGKW
jgi:glycosyltransferase involved in cell wall biosynthesis